MTAPIIQARYEELAQVAERFGRSAEVQNQLIRTVQQHADALIGGSWQGRGMTAFAHEMDNTVMPAMGRLADALAEAQRVTLQISLIVQAAEEEAARPFQGADYLSRQPYGEPVTVDFGDPENSGPNVKSDNTEPGYAGSPGIPAPRVYVVNGINSLGNEPGKIGDDDSLAFESLLERYGYDPNEVRSTPAIYLRPFPGEFSGTDLTGTQYGGWLRPVDWITNSGARGINALTGGVAAIGNQAAYVSSSVYGAVEVTAEYLHGEHGKYTQATYDFVRFDLARSPLLPNQDIILVGHSGGGAVVDDLPGMIERGTGYNVRGVVTLASPISNYDEAGRYAEIVVDLSHRSDIVGQDYIRSDPFGLRDRLRPGQLRPVEIRDPRDDPHGVVVSSWETIFFLSKNFPEMGLNL